MVVDSGAEQWFSVDEVAQALGLQPRTVRNYIRDGRLPAVRIGKQYRIAAADFAALTGSALPPATSAVPAARAPAPGGPDAGSPSVAAPSEAGNEPAPERSLATDVTAVLWISGLAQRDLDRLTTLFTVTGAVPGPDVTVMHLPAERRLKVLVSGPLERVSAFLAYAQAILDTGL